MSNVQYPDPPPHQWKSKLIPSLSLVSFFVAEVDEKKLDTYWRFVVNWIGRIKTANSVRRIEIVFVTSSKNYSNAWRSETTNCFFLFIGGLIVCVSWKCYYLALSVAYRCKFFKSARYSPVCNFTVQRYEFLKIQ